MDHSDSNGQPCAGCSCERSEAPHQTGGIALVGCCAMHFTHGTFRFDEETGECTQWPLCCAEHVHTGPDEPDLYCSAHGVTKPEHTVVLTALGPILPLDEPVVRLSLASVDPGRPGDQVVTGRLTSGQKVILPTMLLPKHPKYGMPALPAPRPDFRQFAPIERALLRKAYEFGLRVGLVKPPPYEVEARGYILLRSGVLFPTVGRQFAQKRIDALFGRVQLAAFRHTFTKQEQALIATGRADPSQLIRSKERVMGISLTADLDAGRIGISITVQALVINPHNPEDGGREFHHVAPIESEVAVVTPVVEERKLVALN